nr:unnamed protein product [Haemonchus contortus]
MMPKGWLWGTSSRQVFHMFEAFGSNCFVLQLRFFYACERSDRGSPPCLTVCGFIEIFFMNVAAIISRYPLR